MAARMKIMVAVLAVAWVGQTWAAGAEQTQPRKPDAPRPGPEERMAMLRAAATDRWMPQDAVTTLERAIRQLEMTEAQTQKLNGIQKSKEEALATARKAYAEAGKALDEAAANGDDAAIRAAAVKVGTALADLQILRKKVAAEMKAVLTPDQLKKLEELKNQARERLQGMREIRPPRQPGAAGGAAPGQAAKPTQPQPNKK